MLKVYWALGIYILLSIVSQPILAQKIYFSESGSVKRINLDGSAVQTIVTGSNYQYIAVDGDLGFLFFNDSQQSYRAFLDGTSPALVTDDGAFAGYNNMAVVPDYESLVYAGISDDMDDLWYGSYYGTPITLPTRITTGISMGGDEEYLDIAYNKSNEKLYFTGYNGAVYSSELDGSGAALVVAADAYGPIGVDYVNSKIYWVRNTGPNYFIMSANLTGGSPTTILSNATVPIESLEVYPEQNAVYFTQNNGVFSTTLVGAPKTTLYTGSNIYNVAIDFDITPPIFYILNPTDNATSAVIGGNLSLTFNENIKRSIATSGTVDDNSIRIYETVGDVLVETIDRASSSISIAANVVTINPTTTLDYNKSYYVLAGNKVFSDLTDNNWVGIVLTTGWNFTTEADPAQFYSRQNGNWNSASTWSHVSHTGPAATNTPGTGSDVVIGNGHTVTLTGNTNVVGNTAAGTWIKSGATLDAALNEFHVWGTLRIDGQLVNGDILAGAFNLFASGSIPIFNEIHYGISGLPGSVCELNTNVIALNGIQSVDGGVLNLNGYEVCTPPAPPPTTPVFTNKTNTSVTLSWTSGGGNAFVVARQGSTSFKPTFGSAYTANPAFGTGSAVGTGNYVVYSGSGNSVTITGLTAATNYEFDLYSFNTTIGGCYNVNNYQPAFATSCVLIAAPSNPLNAQYCMGDTKPAINVNSPGSGRNIRWYDAATAGNLVLGDGSGGDGRGGVFIPAGPSGTFYAETYDGTLQCSSASRTAVTLTEHPPLVPGTASGTQSVCPGSDPTVIDGGTASGGTGVYTYQWESSGAAAGPFSAIIGATQPTYDPPAGITQTTYYHRLTRSATCLEPGNAVAVTLIAPPVVTVQPTPQQVCDGKSATFSIDATGTPLSSQWQVNTGSGFSNIANGGVYTGAASKVLQISAVAGLGGFQYRCIVGIAGSCPVPSSAVPLTLIAKPVVTNQQQSVCEGLAGSGIASVNLTALNGAVTGGTAGLTVAWFTNVGLTNPVANPALAPANNNTRFYAAVTNSNGCSSTAEAVINVNKKPAGAGIISGALTICTNTPSTFTVTGIADADSYAWQVSGGLQILSEAGATASIQAVSGSNGTISVIGENSCGTGGSATRTIQILLSPEVQIVAPAEVIVGEVASLSYESASILESIVWNFGDTQTSSEASPQHLYAAEGNYQVTLNVVDGFNCPATKETTVTVLSIPDLRETNIKNVITANGDHRNGLLYIENLEKYPQNQVILLDRWGVEVFKEENYTNDWDARRNGEFLPAGQYVCIVKLNETGKIYSRTVSIIKRK